MIAKTEVWFYRPGENGSDLLKFNPGALDHISEYAELYPKNIYFEVDPSDI